MARPKSALRVALEKKAAAHAAAAEAAQNVADNVVGGDTTMSGTSSEWSQSNTPGPSPETAITSPSTSTIAPNPTKTPTAAELERLSLPGISACNEHDWDMSSPAAAEAKAHLAPDFVAYFDSFPRPLTFEENMAATREHMEKDPGYSLEVVGVSSDVDEEKGEGKVWLEIENRWSEVRMRGFSELMWRRDEAGKWWCYRHTGMRVDDMGLT